MRGYKNNNLSIVVSMMRSENWIRVVERISSIVGSPVAMMTKISFSKTRCGYKEHTRYVKNYGQGEQYAIHRS